jgi:4-azaleucine resistance transporter AzlC
VSRSRLSDGLRAGVPVGAAGILIGVSFGVLAQPVMGSVAPIVMSAFLFAGSAQFGSLAVLAAGGGAVPAIVAGLLLNARFLPMGIAYAPSLGGSPARRALEGQAVVDASWAMANRGGGRFDRDFMVGATLVQYGCWVTGTALGVGLGDALGDPKDLGLDALFPAFFLALLVPELRNRTYVGVALVAAALTLMLIPMTPPGVPVLAACSLALIGLRLR